MFPLLLLNELADMVYPRLCTACAEPLLAHEHIICLRCRIELPRTDHGLYPDNPVAKKFWGKVPIEQAAAMLHFHKGSRVQSLMHALKYSNRTDVGITLGNMLGYYCRQHHLFEHIDAITAVPLHEEKLLLRGYNQSAVIGEGLSEVLHVPFNGGLLQRHTYTDTQTKKSRLARWENVKDVFVVTAPDEIINKHILIIDDVITTGSTLEACALKLIQSIGVKVSIAAVAFADS